jgi:threonine synthase
MQFRSTRKGPAVSLEKAIMSGTAPDGGLYVPESLPQFAPESLIPVEPLDKFAARVLAPFFAGSGLDGELGAICAEAFSFPAPLRTLEPNDRGGLSVLELFHGPTAAFKDFGARFLAACMARIRGDDDNDSGPVTVLVATSGDTGGAVAAAFHRRPGLRVVVLFPDGRVSARQQHQLTCWGDNVISLAVRGEFDDCQRLVKELFAEPELSRKHGLCSANSINVGRLLPQSVYYAQASLGHWQQSGQRSNFIIPTGNLGNAVACVWAKEMGLPIERIILATNANRTIPDYLDSGEWTPRASIPTLASAMDVGDPSNMERLRDLWGDAREIAQKLSAVPVSDDQIRSRIAAEFSSGGTAWCPHTATAFHVYRNLPDDQRENRHWIVVATAHAAKFDSIVEPLIDESIEPPEDLKQLLQWPARFEIIDPVTDEITSRL